MFTVDFQESLIVIDTCVRNMNDILNKKKGMLKLTA